MNKKILLLALIMIGSIALRAQEKTINKSYQGIKEIEP